MAKVWVRIPEENKNGCSALLTFLEEEVHYHLYISPGWKKGCLDECDELETFRASSLRRFTCLAPRCARLL